MGTTVLDPSASQFNPDAETKYPERTLNKMWDEQYVIKEMSYRDATKILKKHHYHLDRQQGRHEVWKDEEGHSFALPHKHHGKDLSKGIMHALNKEVTHENFADGKVKGKSRPGRVKKAGASCKGSVTDLRAKAKKASGEKANDRWDTLRGGFRIDWDVDNQDSLIVQGDIYDGETESNASTPILTSPFKESFNDESEFAGWNVLTRWKRVFSDSSNMELQLYFDRTERESAMFREDRDTFDFDFQHRFKFGERHDIVWGLGYRLNHDDIRNTFSLSFNPDDRYMSLYSGFVQDEITLIEDKLLLTVGSKISYNKFTDSEIQPNARLLWKLHERHSAWISLSRAVRTPSRAENDVRSNSMVSASVPFPSLVSTFGSDGFDAEELYAYELGYRFIPSDSLSVDIALYYNNYDKLLTVEPGAFAVETTPQPTHFLIPFIIK